MLLLTSTGATNVTVMNAIRRAKCAKFMGSLFPAAFISRVEMCISILCMHTKVGLYGLRQYHM